MSQVPTPPDSAARDSTKADSVRVLTGPLHSPLAYLIYPIGLVAAGVMLTVPAPMAFLGQRGEDSMAFVRNHVTVSTALGGHYHAGQTWSNSVAVEVMVKSVALDLSREEYRGVRPARHTTARIGYFVHPRRRVAGGLMIGYRQATDLTEASGLALGLPLVGESGSATVRLDPTYVFADAGSFWHFRFEFTYPIPRTPVFAGMRIAAQSQLGGRSPELEGQPQLASFGLVLGATFGRSRHRPVPSTGVR